MHSPVAGFAGRAVGALLALALPIECLHAQDFWGGSVGVTSDYRVRGVSKTRGDAAIQAGLHAQVTSGWVVGAWASNVSRNRGRSSAIELDAYTGYHWTIAPEWDAKVVGTHYWYPDDPAAVSYDYDEVAVSLIFRSQFIATVAYSPNSTYLSRYGGSWHWDEGASASYELTGMQPLTSALSFNAGVGYNDVRELFDAGYWYWNAGLTYSLGPVQLDVTRIDSDAAAEALFGSTATRAGWSAAVSWRF